jgi:hypothetical protein
MGFLDFVKNGVRQGIGKATEFANHMKDFKDRAIQKTRDVISKLPAGELINKGIDTIMNTTPVGTVLRKANDLFDTGVHTLNHVNSAVQTGESVAGRMKQIEQDTGISPAKQMIALANDLGNSAKAVITGTERRLNELKSEM